MRRVITTLLLVLTLVGGVGIALAAAKISVPVYTDYIDIGGPPKVDSQGAKAPDIMGSWD